MTRKRQTGRKREIKEILDLNKSKEKLILGEIRKEEKEEGKKREKKKK